MPPYQQQLESYERRPQPGNPARTEAWALMQSAKRLASSVAEKGLDIKQAKEERKAALRLNWRLWTIFQAELVLPREDVPEEIRINMLTLCKFIDKHTIGAIVKPTPEALQVLVDINRNIAAGLLQAQNSLDAAKAEEAKKTEQAPAAAAAARQEKAPVSLDAEF